MSSSRQEYIEAYSELAKVQMRRYGIPASVTLAQAIIESANGKSTLSNQANNHFGINISESKVISMATMSLPTMTSPMNISRNTTM